MLQRQAGNVTGGLRLTQAGWEVSENPINQTTYFRDDVFGHLEWSEWKIKPYSEIAEADFIIEILGKSYGAYRLAITHKPQRRSSTRKLHYDFALGRFSRDNSAIKFDWQNLQPFCTPKDQPEPFRIEIA